MKKKILSILCVIAAVLSLCACVNQNDAEEAVLNNLNSYAAEHFESYTIRIETANRNGGKVTEYHSVSVVEGVRNVSSRIEKINPFTIDGDTITAPEEYMTVSETTFTVNEGESTAFGLPGFRFNRDSLSNVKCDTKSYPYVLTADVTSTAAFMQNSIDGSNFKLEVEYVTGALYSLQLRYTTESGNNVTVTYTFG